MSEQTPEPTPAQSEQEQRENTEERLGGDLQFGGTVQPGWYGQPHGQGRWFTLYAHQAPLGVVWTNDDDGLGFIATSMEGRTRVPEFVTAFRQGKIEGGTASSIFDHWAALASLGLQAGPVVHGNLDTLPV